MLALFSNANVYPLFSKLCQHNLPTPTHALPINMWDKISQISPMQVGRQKR